MASTNWSTKTLSALRRFDAYPKPLEDFRIKTKFGGLMTIICGAMMILLFASETRDYLTPEIREELIVDTTRAGKLKINLDVVFPRISCDYLVLDAMDISGEQHIDIEHNVFKRKLDMDGKPIEDPQKQAVIGVQKGNSTSVNDAKVDDDAGETTTKTTTTPACGSCYGAETAERKCCATCNEVREAYRLKTWKFDPRGVEQCKGIEGVPSLTEAEERAFKEGCQIYGYLEVNRVGGSFHVAPGKSFSLNSVHIHDVQPFSSTDFNTTHRIRHLSFGRQLEGGLDSNNPLDGVETIAEKGATMFQYYLKIVPTLYSRTDSLFASNQFSVTRHSKVVSLMSGESGMPGVFFSYELAPVMVKYTEKSKSFGHYATGLCAIIGGVFTVAGLIDKIFYTSSRLLEEKLQLGKST